MVIIVIANRVVFFCLSLLFIPSIIYLPNPGGVGLALPFNLLFSGAAALLIAVCWYHAPPRRTTITPTCRLILAACLLMALPALFTRAEWQSTALWRLAGLFAGAGFYFTWLQMHLTARQRHGVLYLILLAAAGQALIVMLQLFAPSVAQSWVPVSEHRALGIFQQPNVVASFIATGLALALATFLLPGFRLASARMESWRLRAIALALLVMPMVLTWLQSRTGWLAALLVLGLFVLFFGRRFPQRIVVAALLALSGVAVGAVVMKLGSGLSDALAYTSHAHSNHARYTMLRDTLTMIADKPLTGWGYGGFEYSFQHFRIYQDPPIVVTEIARHPHNELLLWWVEGGVIALLGILLLLWSGIKLIARARQRDRQAFACRKSTAGEAIALCLALLPVTLHTQTEYPFYLSTLHWLVFLLLLAMLDRLVSPRLWRENRLQCWKYPMLALSLSALAMVIGGGYSGRVLTQAERSGLQDMQPVEALPAWTSWIHRDRLSFDRQLAGLLAFNHTRDEQQLHQYADWAQGYLSHRIDKNVYANLLLIFRHEEKPALAERYRQEAERLFPRDARFSPASSDGQVTL